MGSGRSHNIAAKRIARKYNTEYNEGRGPDINTPSVTIEVETPETVKDGIRQLQGFRKPVYIAGSNQQAVEAALAATDGTTIGVMDAQGNIVKKSTRKRK